MHDASTHIDLAVANFLAGPLARQLYRAATPLTARAWEAPGEPVPFLDASTAHFAPIEVGARWGRPWGTTWLHLTGEVPADFRTVPGCRTELVIDLGFDTGTPGFQAEGAAWRPEGTLIKGIEPRNNYVPVPPDAERIELYVEAASNPEVKSANFVSPGPIDDPAGPGDDPIYRLRRLDLVLLDETVWELTQDVRALHGLARQLGPDSVRRHQILAALQQMLSRVDPDDLPGTAAAGRESLVRALSAPAGSSEHRVHAVGHAHIDSAWLWPVREAVRKCARTFANVLALMDSDPELIFACSSAQQFDWMKRYYPELYGRIAARVADGRFVPVGGMWVESDTNLPGGEALVRQFLLGTKFFSEEFGMTGNEVWLPDSFGYTAALPQIAAGAGKSYFLSQKLSWNDTNSFPHHTFDWEGIDGTRIFTHFPPAETYNSELSAEELLRSRRNYREKGRANTSLLPFGWGDGGGGPTREMMAAAHRYADLDGVPTVEMSSPQRFFSTARDEYPDPPVWVGELYLEYHRGTYTSQHRMKAGNRRSEHLLREAELWATTATVRTGAPYPREELRSAWELVLLQQFHDILPGSSIARVHAEADRNYGQIAVELEQIIAQALIHLVEDGTTAMVANASPFPGPGAVAPLSVGPADTAGPVPTVDWDGDSVVLANGVLNVRIDGHGEISSLVRIADGRELMAPGQSGARLRLHRDRPNEFEAWNLDRSYADVGTDLTECVSLELYRDELDVGVRVEREFGNSRVRQQFALRAGSDELVITLDIDWQERQQLLKLVFPLDVQTSQATSEIAFGHLTRPVHTNTSWDQARYETVAHRWVHLSEPGFGVALTNSATYGYDVTRVPRPGGGTVTVVGASVLRAPAFPDPQADRGHHRMEFAIGPADTVLATVAAGYRRNLPVRTVSGNRPVAPLLTVDDPGLVVESLKLAEDGSADVIVRLYEARGGRVDTLLRLGFAARTAVLTDLLEQPLADQQALQRIDDRVLALRARPFQIRTVRISRAAE